MRRIGPTRTRAYAISVLLPLVVAASLSPWQPNKAVSVKVLEADLEIVDVKVTVPPAVSAGQAFELEVRSTVRNNGPDGPIDAAVDSTLTIPLGCTEPVATIFKTTNESFAASSSKAITETWSITCAASGVYAFRGAAQALQGSDVFMDTNGDNNFNGATVSVEVDPAMLPVSGGAPLDPGGGAAPVLAAAGVALTIGAGIAAALAWNRRRVARG